MENFNQYPDYEAIAAEARDEDYDRLVTENALLQARLYKQAENAGYAYELLNSILRGTIKASNTAGRTAIRKAMARLIQEPEAAV